MVRYEITMMVEVGESETPDTLSQLLRHIPSLNIQSLHLARRSTEPSSGASWGYVSSSPFTYTGSSYRYPWSVDATE